MSQEAVGCLVCGQQYPAGDGLLASNGHHFWTCGDPCQQKFLEQGGVEGKVRFRVSGPVGKAQKERTW